MLHYKVSVVVIVDSWNLSVHEKVSIWKLVFWVEVMKQLLESTFLNSINGDLIHAYEFQQQVGLALLPQVSFCHISAVAEKLL